jgi:hypothetical protein
MGTLACEQAAGYEKLSWKEVAMSQHSKADANPTRAFFVRTITRDISFEDCILDLIDNSIDGACRMEGGQQMSLDSGVDLSKYKIDIRFTSEYFSIIDNCGGLSLDDAVNYAFTFGRKDDVRQDRYSIGVYGIGMKRALFKIGKQIDVRSTFITQNHITESFHVPINVLAWLSNTSKDWSFDLESSEALTSPGVHINISELNDDAQTTFDNPGFEQRLRRTISRDYTLHMHRGLLVEVNGRVVNKSQIEMRQGGDFAPVRLDYQDPLPEGNVSVTLVAEMTAPPPDTPDPNGNADEGRDARSGWYVACNGRIVLEADKSEVSGWGTDGWQMWHPQYAGFIGLLMFTAENPTLLPLTTTKRSVDASSAVFRHAKPRMREISQRWIEYTTARRQALEAAKDAEAKTSSVPIFSVPTRPSLSLPALRPAPPKERYGNVHYSVPIRRLQKLGDAFGTNIYREVGLQSFEYAYNDLVGK